MRTGFLLLLARGRLGVTCLSVQTGCSSLVTFFDRFGVLGAVRSLVSVSVSVGGRGGSPGGEVLANVLASMVVWVGPVCFVWWDGFLPCIEVGLGGDAGVDVCELSPCPLCLVLLDSSVDCYICISTQCSRMGRVPRCVCRSYRCR
eukprot:scaffold144772_cov30-Attheya_sp.AAC.1